MDFRVVSKTRHRARFRSDFKVSFIESSEKAKASIEGQAVRLADRLFLRFKACDTDRIFKCDEGSC